MTRKKVDYYAASAVRGNDEILACAFDTETEGLGGKLLSVQWGTPFTEIQFDKSQDMLTNFFADLMKFPAPCIWYGHFAQYDWQYMLNELADRGFDFEIGMRTDNDVYEIRIKRADGKRVIMRDSYALWNSPLEKLAKSFCPEIPKLEIDIEKFDPDNAEHQAYAKRDVQILLVGLPRLFSMLAKHFGVNPNGTFASTSLKGWQVTLPKDNIFRASNWGPQEVFIRESYYGGLVFLTNTNHQKDCVTFDINSSYPYAMMTHGVPYGRAIETNDYSGDRMGIYRVRVRSPDNLVVPIIPARDARGSMRWFRGEFDTVCTNRELVFAAQNGYEILEVYEGIVFEETIFPFTPFIQKCMNIRKEFKGGPEELLAKFMQNSLYGKFGSRRERLRMMHAHSATEEELIDATPYDEAGRWYVKKELDETMRCMPAWAVFITAHARLRLLQAVYSVGVENVIYGDTDSITIKAGPHEALIDSGLEYGQWKREKEWKEFRAIAPKVYSGILADGRRVGAAKGLPRKHLTAEHWKSLLEDGTATAQALSLASLRVAMKKGGVTPAVLLQRKSSSLDNSVNFQQLENGQVRAKIAA